MALLQTIDLKRYFGETRAVDNVNLSIGEGEFVSLVGPSGCGKTTVMRILAGLVGGYSGSVSVGGRKLRRIIDAARVIGLGQCAYVPFKCGGVHGRSQRINRPDPGLSHTADHGADHDAQEKSKQQYSLQMQHAHTLQDE